MPTRRAFLKAAAIVPTFVQRSVQSPVATTLRDSSFDPWIEVDASLLRRNVAEIGRHVGGRPILAVIKNNGYGLGVVNVARVFERLDPIAGFAAVKLHEAMTLRDAGFAKPILLLGPFADSELPELVARNVMPMVYGPMGDVIDRAAGR